MGAAVPGSARERHLAASEEPEPPARHLEYETLPRGCLGKNPSLFGIAVHTETRRPLAAQALPGPRSSSRQVCPLSAGQRRAQADRAAMGMAQSTAHSSTALPLLQTTLVPGPELGQHLWHVPRARGALPGHRPSLAASSPLLSPAQCPCHALGASRELSQPSHSPLPVLSEGWL